MSSDDSSPADPHLSDVPDRPVEHITGENETVSTGDSPQVSTPPADHDGDADGFDATHVSQRSLSRRPSDTGGADASARSGTTSDDSGIEAGGSASLGGNASHGNDPDGHSQPSGPGGFSNPSGPWGHSGGTGSSGTQHDESLPTIIGYSDLVPIGRGGFSMVYSAVEEQLHRRVAIKVITGDDDAVARLERELRALGMLDEVPNIISAHSVVRTSFGQPALIMRLFTTSLSRLVRSTGPQPMEQVQRWATQLATGLDAAHERGVIHRDLKPENVLLDDGLNAYLADFGIAALATIASGTSTVMSISPPHAPPERLNGVSTGDVIGDVYSLASTLYFVLTGSAPFGTTKDGGAAGLIERIVKQPVPDNDALPRPVVQVFRRAMSKDPAERYRTATDLANALIAASGQPDVEPVQLPSDGTSSGDKAQFEGYTDGSVEDATSGYTGYPGSHTGDGTGPVSGVGGTTGITHADASEGVTAMGRGTSSGSNHDDIVFDPDGREDLTVARKGPREPRTTSPTGGPGIDELQVGPEDRGTVHPEFIVGSGPIPLGGDPRWSDPRSIDHTPEADTTTRSAGRKRVVAGLVALIVVAAIIGITAFSLSNTNTDNASAGPVGLELSVENATKMNLLPDDFHVTIGSEVIDLSGLAKKETKQAFSPEAFEGDDDTVTVVVKVPERHSFAVDRNGRTRDGKRVDTLVITDNWVQLGDERRSRNDDSTAEDIQAERDRVTTLLLDSRNERRKADKQFNELFTEVNGVLQAPQAVIRSGLDDIVIPVYTKAVAFLDIQSSSDLKSQTALSTEKDCAAAKLKAFERSGNYNDLMSKEDNARAQDQLWDAATGRCQAANDARDALQPAD